MSNLPRPSRAGSLLGVALAAALAWPGAPPAGAAEPPPLRLGLPLPCEIGKSCWIVNYVDVDKSKNVRDYKCGKSSYDGHKGVDFAIRDMGVMRRGVPVLAAAAGTVAGLRDGMEDVDFNLIGGPRAVKGKECGNGVTLRHTDGWSTQYCHLRRGSVSVKKGQRVAAGARLGLVGHSGLAMFPHVHIQVRKGKEIVDPFVGAGPSKKCGPDGKTLVRSSRTEKKDLARAFRPGAIPRPGDAWPAGVYRGEIRLARKTRAGGRRVFTATRQVTIR